MEHENDPDIDEPYVPPAGNVLGGQDESQATAEEPTQADTAEGQGMLWLLGSERVVILYVCQSLHLNQNEVWCVYMYT